MRCIGARDSRLDRTVALKVSKAELSERFAGEARSIAALNRSAQNATNHGLAASTAIRSTPAAFSASKTKASSKSRSTNMSPLTTPNNATNSTYSPKPSSPNGANSGSGSPKPPKSKSPSPKMSATYNYPSPPPTPRPTSPTASPNPNRSSNSTSATTPNSTATTATASKICATYKPNGRSRTIHQSNPNHPPPSRNSPSQSKPNSPQRHPKTSPRQTNPTSPPNKRASSSKRPKSAASWTSISAAGNRRNHGQRRSYPLSAGITRSASLLPVGPSGHTSQP